MKQIKATLRQEMKELRRELHAADLEHGENMAARHIAAHILTLPEIKGEVQRGIGARSNEPYVVAGFHPIQSEVNCLYIMKALNAIQCRCALPVINGRGQHLAFREWDLLEDLKVGPYGTKEPKSELLYVMPDIILVPLLAFDERGYRLGYGGGYYDRTLAIYREKGHPFTAVGVAFEGQKRDKVPVGKYDQSLDVIVTEQKVYRP